MESAIEPVEKQSLAGTTVEIPGVGTVIFSGDSASDPELFPDLNMSHQQMCMMLHEMDGELRILRAQVAILLEKDIGRNNY